MTKKDLFSKARICKEFGLTARTLVHLEHSGLLELEWEATHGLAVTELDAHTKTVLDCARNHPLNFGAGKIEKLPFLRFLFLRFLQLPLDFIAYELKERNLYDFDRTKGTDINTIYEWYFSKVPQGLSKMVEERRPPKNKEEKDLFNIFLDTCELRVAYENPQIDAEMSFFGILNVKTVVDAALSTTGTFAEVAAFLKELVGLTINIPGLVFYQTMYHDMSLMSPNDMKAYFSGIAPSHRDEIRLAIGQTLEMYRVKSGLEVEFSTDSVFSSAMSMIAQEMLSTPIASVEASEKFHSLLKSFNLLVDRNVKLNQAKGGATIQIPEFMKTMKLVDVDLNDGLIQLPNLVKENERSG